jgi:hypothetical protein
MLKVPFPPPRPPCTYCFAVLGSQLRASRLLGKCATTWMLRFWWPIVWICIFVLLVLQLELTALCLQGKCSTT